MKISKIIDEDLFEIGKINREIDFFNNFGSKYPNYFTSYYGNYITTTNILNNEICDIMININDLENIELQNYIVKHKNSNIFIYRIPIFSYCLSILKKNIKIAIKFIQISF